MASFIVSKLIGGLFSIKVSFAKVLNCFIECFPVSYLELESIIDLLKVVRCTFMFSVVLPVKYKSCKAPYLFTNVTLYASCCEHTLSIVKAVLTTVSVVSLAVNGW